MSTNARAIVKDVLNFKMVEAIWSTQYEKVLPITFSNFEISAVLSAVFYMFRFGHRRGRGHFLEKIAPECNSISEQRHAATVERVAERLAQTPEFKNFTGDVERAILGDLLLCFNLENRRHELGRNKPVQRVAPTHYMASWIDLPENSGHLRFVPEMIVALLANQDSHYVEGGTGKKNTRFPIAGENDRELKDNLLLRKFSAGVTRKSRVADVASDSFVESAEIGIDQLLVVRLAGILKQAPDKVQGGREKGKISNQRPIAEKAAVQFSDDIRRFIREYGSEMPRHVFVELLEACIAIGLTTIFTSIVEILAEWANGDGIRQKVAQQPANIFVDCSNGVDRKVRNLAERSFDDLMRRAERVPEILMMLRLLDYQVDDAEGIERGSIPTRPYATEWLNLLGELLHERHDEAKYIHHAVRGHCKKLADALTDSYPEVSEVLLNSTSEPNPVRRLSVALASHLQTNSHTQLVKLVDASLNVNRSNALGRKRRSSAGMRTSSAGSASRDVRSIVFTDAVLDYLVHLCILKSGGRSGARPLSVKRFLADIRDRYGFYVDTAPPGMNISNELLRMNRMIMERRLRDLGLLTGVNDAEAMKRLRSRFEPTNDG